MEISQRIAKSSPLATTALHGRVESLRAQGQAIIDFSIAVSHFSAPPAVLDAVVDALRQPTLPYTAVSGAPELRSRLCAKLREENGIAAAAEEVIVTNGAKQALFEALYVLTDPGDAVLVFRPYWPAYVASAELLGLRVLLADLPARLTPELLDALPPARILILNNPHNPSGKLFDCAELDHLAAWMARSGCRVIVDESYEHLVFEGRHTSLAARPDWRELGIVTLYSTSQSYAMMGWRAGFALAPAHVVRAMDTLQGPITAAAPALSQLALGAAFAGGARHAMLEDYRGRRDLVLALVAGTRWLRMASPHSGPYLWADVSALTLDTIGFAGQLLDQRQVAVMPGEALGVPGHIRIGFISDDVHTLQRGVESLLAFGNAMPPRTARP
ncbi:MAG: aminotransferase class I/II-fold pyridoxal phosphate-dependent enzyme [Pseudomonadota bacterium]